MNKKPLCLLGTMLLLSCTAASQADSGFVLSHMRFIKGEHVLEFEDYGKERSLMRVSDRWSNGGMFRSVWRKENVVYEDGKGKLSLVDEGDVNYGSEIRFNQGYLYGYFGGRMKTFRRSGTVQSLFTYNGGQYIWDEIDIEFLGKDTTKVQFNYYHEGVGGHEYLHSLGFDASDDFHDYGFLWEENRITWFVDFVPVYSVVASLGQWGFFFANVWAGKDSVIDWTGRYAPTETPLVTEYDYLCYSPLSSNE